MVSINWAVVRTELIMQNSNHGLKLIVVVSESQMFLSKGKSGHGKRAPEAKSINFPLFTHKFIFLKEGQVTDENSGCN